MCKVKDYCPSDTCTTNSCGAGVAGGKNHCYTNTCATDTCAGAGNFGENDCGIDNCTTNVCTAWSEGDTCETDNCHWNVCLVNYCSKDDNCRWPWAFDYCQSCDREGDVPD